MFRFDTKPYYIYDDDGYYIEKVDAFPSPEEPGKYLQPVNSTEKPNPSFIEVTETCRYVKSIDDWVVSKKPEPMPPPFVLETAKTKKQSELNRDCQAQIFAGYESNALGDVHLYPATNQDQANMVASVTNALYPDLPADWKTAFWCRSQDGEWAYRDHTAAQIRKAGADGKEAISAALLKHSILQAQVMNLSSIATQADLEAITW